MHSSSVLPYLVTHHCRLMQDYHIWSQLLCGAELAGLNHHLSHLLAPPHTHTTDSHYLHLPILTTTHTSTTHTSTTHLPILTTTHTSTTHTLTFSHNILAAFYLPSPPHPPHPYITHTHSPSTHTPLHTHTHTHTHTHPSTLTPHTPLINSLITDKIEV